jgi:hypothetical protein
LAVKAERNQAMSENPIETQISTMAKRFAASVSIEWRRRGPVPNERRRRTEAPSYPQEGRRRFRRHSSRRAGDGQCDPGQ